MAGMIQGAIGQVETSSVWHLAAVGRSQYLSMLGLDSSLNPFFKHILMPRIIILHRQIQSL